MKFEKKNAKYKAIVDKYHKSKMFYKGDVMMLFLYKERFQLELTCSFN